MPRIYLLILLLAAAIVVFSPGCDELVTETIEVTIAGHPTAEFTPNPDSGCVPLMVNFDDASTGPVRTWIWNFGDGTLDTLRASSGDIGDVSHTYQTSGVFNVTLSVFDSADGSDAETKKRAVIVGHNVDSVKLSDTVGCPGEEFTFQAFNPYGVSTWLWNFGDNDSTSDTSVIQTHTYAEPGTYEFKLRVTGACGQKVMVDTVRIMICAEPYFTVDPDETCLGSPLYFVDATPPAIDTMGGVEDTAVVVKWHWNFGNGITQEYTVATDTVEYTYPAAGTFPVTLTLTTDEGGVTSFVDTVTVVAATDAVFTAAPSQACQLAGRQFVTRFTDNSTGATSWLWDFGDGYTSTDQHPAHAYLDPGVYTVRLDVTGPCGVDSSLRADLIEYSDQLDPTIDFVLDDTVVTVNIPITATDTSPAAAVVHRIWNYGDGSTPSTSETGFHAYEAAGTYWFKLTRYNVCDTLSDSIQVTVEP
ncbi:MAG: PKD domain-containing protein [Candidatus Zixiibacteriota bacterium]